MNEPLLSQHDVTHDPAHGATGSMRLRSRTSGSTSSQQKGAAPTDFDNRFDELKTLIIGIQTNFDKKLTGLEELLESKLSAKIEEIVDEKLADKLQQSADNANKITALEKKVEKLEQVIKTQQKTIKEHKEETKGANEDLTKHLEKLESHGRKLNLRFDGIPEQEGEDCKHLVETAIRDMQLRDMRSPVDIAHRVGKSTATRTAPIIARFKTVAEKSRVLENAKLARRNNIYISNDLPQAVQQRREYLSKALKEAKQHDRRAKLVHDKLKIHDTYYTVDTISSASFLRHSHEIENDTQLRFYGYLSPMSNFYQCDVKLSGIKFTSAEQAFQFARARHRRDNFMSRRILGQNNPAVIKRMANAMKSTTQDDHQKDSEIMEAVVLAKFEQNSDLGDILLATGDKRLIECNPYDQVFSCGLKMDDERLDEMEYPGQNKLGSILEDVRSQLRDSD